jgi:DNA-binding transcriptional MerR regulator
VEPVTVNGAASATGWSPRMLRYLEQLGLALPRRTPAGYRQYDEHDLARLRSLHELRRDHQLDLAGLAFAARLRREPQLRAAVDDWLASGDPPMPAAWLDFEQRKHQELLAA